MHDPVTLLHDFLQQRRLDGSRIRGLVVALSGGADSYALLRAAASVAASVGFSLRALHVHHGLHPDATQWAARACAQADGLSVACRVLSVRLHDDRNIESQARQLRYHALTDALADDEALLLAHHQRDQAETVVQRLLRGSGVKGLAGMAPCSRWQRQDGQSRWRWRPWLNLPYAQLRQWLAEQAPDEPVVDDPANADPRYERSFIRHQWLPLAEQRWPHVQTALATSAEHLRQQSEALAYLASSFLQQHASTALSVTLLKAQPTSVQQVLLAQWLHQRGAPSLPRRYWPRVAAELLAARPDAQPRLQWSGWVLSRYRDELRCQPDVIAPLPIDWLWPDLRLPCVLDGLRLSLLVPAEGSLQAMARVGGERWQARGSHHHHTLKKWCQQQGISPAQRLSMRLLQDEQRRIVALVWMSTDGQWQVAYGQHWRWSELLMSP